MCVCVCLCFYCECTQYNGTFDLETHEVLYTHNTIRVIIAGITHKVSRKVQSQKKTILSKHYLRCGTVISGNYLLYKLCIID